MRLPLRADHAVAGDEDRDRVAADRPADLAGGDPTADLGRQGPVGGRAAVGDLGKEVPDTALEGVAAVGRHGDVEGLALAGEVLLELGEDAAEAGIDAGAERGLGRRVPMRREVEAGDRVAGAGDGEVAERRDGDGVANGALGHALETVAPAGA